MIFQPHNYQQYAINYILDHKIVCLMLDMGLGKTAIVLSAIEKLMYDSFDVSKVLVIAPLRVARSTWPSEIHKWDHTKHLTYSLVVGTEGERLEALSMKADIYIINRENVAWLVKDSGCKFDFDMLVVDELSSFKSAKSLRFRCLSHVRPTFKRVIGLTGTPTSNGLMDLFAEYKLLDMGKRLGRFISSFRNEYFVPYKRNGPIVYSYMPLPFAEKAIYEQISDITISMKAKDHLQMPDCLYNNVFVELSEDEKAKYDYMVKNLSLKIDSEKIDAKNVAVLVGKLSQMANGFIYTDTGDFFNIHDRKLDALEDLIEASNGKPMLIAYWFKKDLEKIEAKLHKLHIPFSRLDSDESIDRWNNGEIPVALIHPAAAGHGLNLQKGGSTLVWYGLTWSLELYQQTNARLYRQGQEETVVIHHILTANTIDERILQVINSKGETQSALIEAVKAIL